MRGSLVFSWLILNPQFRTNNAEPLLGFAVYFIQDVHDVSAYKHLDSLPYTAASDNLIVISGVTTTRWGFLETVKFPQDLCSPQEVPTSPYKLVSAAHSLDAAFNNMVQIWSGMETNQKLETKLSDSSTLKTKCSQYGVFSFLFSIYFVLFILRGQPNIN